jgi:GNAT superfamily N-acetyltransferase
MPVVLEPSWVGRRVSVRRVVGRDQQGRVQFGDVVGDLLHVDEVMALVEVRGGTVEVPVATVALAKLVAPSTAEELALESIAARGWRAAETAELGGWLLRANAGFTRRANSVLPLKPPGLPLTEAIEAARTWYAERGLALCFAVPTESRRLLDAELGERGWVPSPDVLVLTARLDLLPRDGTDAARLDPQPDDVWLQRYRDGTGASPAARQLLTRHDNVVFASVREGAAASAIGRGCVDDGWLGITAVEVDAAERRQGLATQILHALWAWGRAQGAKRTYVQVSTDNPGAVALYEQAGYREHHAYRYRDEPSTAPAHA